MLYHRIPSYPTPLLSVFPSFCSFACFSFRCRRVPIFHLQCSTSPASGSYSVACASISGQRACMYMSLSAQFSALAITSISDMLAFVAGHTPRRNRPPQHHDWRLGEMLAAMTCESQGPGLFSNRSGSVGSGLLQEHAGWRRRRRRLRPATPAQPRVSPESESD